MEIGGFMITVLKLSFNNFFLYNIKGFFYFVAIQINVNSNFYWNLHTLSFDFFYEPFTRGNLFFSYKIYLFAVN